MQIERRRVAILHNGVIVQKVNECVITARYVNIALVWKDGD